MIYAYLCSSAEAREALIKIEFWSFSLYINHREDRVWYRTMNAGKFPSASDAKKNVGGCYYVVRRILQELEYNSSLATGLQEVSRKRKPKEVVISVKPSLDVLIPSSDSRLEADSFDTLSVTKPEEESGLLTMDVDTSSSQMESDSTIFYDVKRNRVFVDKEVDKGKSLFEAEEFSSNDAIADESILNLQTEESSSLNIESAERSQSLISVESDKSKDGGTQSHRLMDECEDSLHSDLESSVTKLKEMASEDFLKYDELNPDDKKHKSKIIEAEEFSSNDAIADESILNLQTEESSSINIESEERSRSLISVESDKSKDGGTQSHRPMDECEDSLHSDLESSVTKLKEMASENFLKYDDLNHDDKKHKSKILEIHEWESHKVPASTAEPENKSSMWQNLKSFANGIIGMWRRS
ncbi:uncharacterized protein [Henckelia pumila]|uniref:uncharacterized protein isoform X2 n=1 Tax=Henckelia pumila TaxID=405737 RepID=UPI003C6E52E3